MSHPKHITIHIDGKHSPQSVVLHPEEQDTFSSLPHPGPLVKHAFKAGLVPHGHVCKLRSGEILHPDANLYEKVNHLDEIFAVAPDVKVDREYPKRLFKVNGATTVHDEAGEKAAKAAGYHDSHEEAKAAEEAKVDSSEL